ncbi:hypothetical protein EUGRSUZ_B01043 [Eucalyptus grandis]|uniref:Uncharacterized protein n=2 Tax=Eucalyptus grandis TaxID=71139 RepID=A0ACC3LPD1_EUCGR|nr:hypothetical protein EUGRSUZ_B01043 [Eucalyptus grandis]
MHVQNHAAPSLSQFNRSTKREDFDRRSSHVQHACKVDRAAKISSTGHLFEDFDSLKPTSCCHAPLLLRPAYRVQEQGVGHVSCMDMQDVLRPPPDFLSC